ncbi:Ppx/GppA phosphatase family protein [Rhizobium halophytocola]|uniref:Exopolyphosphatase/guanosine-5'-triphosphate, 3'-diphosphate pyrophosphatase n=1 Tax=Rhizobium halophytocola TaxID=735519 RepID=A0ABS4DXW4_9HYPH|nr:Ppx/GppA phosphatase family protein [Rhizobium halophytocola]MBP1850520.1 exopolyphosphatase/guanosine-5'-triphosphate,3'-diphosphate pyrophosphatase [Rhizobium halophytocola]
MTDPESGAKPHIDGASAKPREEAKASRRSRGKRRGKSASSNPAPAGASEGAKTPEPAERPDQGEGKSLRKRKRRRRGGGKPGVPGQAPAAGQAKSGQVRPGQIRPVQARERPGARPADPAGDDTQRNDGGPTSLAKSTKKRRRRRNRRTGGPGAAQPNAVVPVVVPDIGPISVRAAEGRPSGPAPAVQPASTPDLYAALDLGTNNCRLLIAQPTKPGNFRVVDAFSRIVRLGEGLGASGRLSDDAMDRAVEALKICAAKLAGRKIRRMRLIATEACRAAANGEEFLDRVTRETGLELEIINRETEARLAVSGCSSLVGREARSVVLFDIGGGSSEIAVIRIGGNRASRLAHHITHWTSLPVGVVTLSERHGGRDVTPDIFEAMIGEVTGMLGHFDCPDFVDAGLHLIGTSGTVTTLAGVHLDLPRYDRRRVDGLWLSDDEVSAMQAKLLSWDYTERAANPCIGPDRADLVLAGCAILEAIRRRWPASRMRVADRGLREGLLTDMMADDGVWRRGRSRRPLRDREL